MLLLLSLFMNSTDGWFCFSCTFHSIPIRESTYIFRSWTFSGFDQYSIASKCSENLKLLISSIIGTGLPNLCLRLKSYISHSVQGMRDLYGILWWASGTGLQTFVSIILACWPLNLLKLVRWVNILQPFQKLEVFLLKFRLLPTNCLFL